MDTNTPNELFFSSSDFDSAQATIRDIFDLKSTTPLAVITKADYEAQEGGEREDSDNYLQEKRLGAESDIVPIIYRKYSRGEARNEYYRVVLKHVNGEIREDYLMIVPDLE